MDIEELSAKKRSLQCLDTFLGRKIFLQWNFVERPGESMLWLSIRSNISTFYEVGKPEEKPFLKIGKHHILYSGTILRSIVPNPYMLTSNFPVIGTEHSKWEKLEDSTVKVRFSGIWFSGNLSFVKWYEVTSLF